MIKKLQYKFVIVIMSLLFLVFAIILGALNFMNYKSGEYQSRSMLRMLADNEGIMPHENTPSIPFTTRPQPGFGPTRNITVKLDTENEVFEVISRSQDYTLKELNKYIKEVISQDKTYGKIGSLRYLKQDRAYGNIIVFIDNSMESESILRLLYSSLIIGFASLFMLFFISLYLSKLVVKPVKETFEKQKQFISDASHELKTPLSVIGVNADVLESEIGESKWLDFIKSETSRMNILVNQLLNITRLDDSNNTIVMNEFDLSQAVLQIVLPFESTAFEAKKQYDYDVPEDIPYIGDEQSIKQLIAILIDNAIKNANSGGTIKVTLKRHNNKINLEVFNTGKGIEESEREIIFERFYRSDSSRARDTGGYGLGLSIAKSIVERHHGKISVQSKVGEWTRFIVVL